MLKRAFSPDLVDRVIARTVAGQMRNRLLPSRLMVSYVMDMASFAAVGLRVGNGPFQGLAMRTKDAIFKARTRLGTTVMAELFPEVTRPALGSAGKQRILQILAAGQR